MTIRTITIAMIVGTIKAHNKKPRETKRTIAEALEVNNKTKVKGFPAYYCYYITHYCYYHYYYYYYYYHYCDYYYQYYYHYEYYYQNHYHYHHDNNNDDYYHHYHYNHYVGCGAPPEKSMPERSPIVHQLVTTDPKGSVDHSSNNNDTERSCTIVLRNHIKKNIWVLGIVIEKLFFCFSRFLGFSAQL